MRRGKIAVSIYAREKKMGGMSGTRLRVGRQRAHSVKLRKFVGVLKREDASGANFAEELKCGGQKNVANRRDDRSLKS